MWGGLGSGASLSFLVWVDSHPRPAGRGPLGPGGAGGEDTVLHGDFPAGLPRKDAVPPMGRFLRSGSGRGVRGGAALRQDKIAHVGAAV